MNSPPDQKSAAGIKVGEPNFEKVVDIQLAVTADKPPDLHNGNNPDIDGEDKSDSVETSKRFETYLDQRGRATCVIRDHGNPYAVPIRSKTFEHILRREAKVREVRLRKADLAELIDELEADAEVEGEIIHIFHRVAPIPNGIEIDRGCEDQTRYRITAKGFELITEGSEATFSRTITMLPLATPADKGDLSIIDKYLNLEEDDIVMFKGLVSYINAHPKVPSTNYPITAMIGGQGTGKSFQSKLFQSLIDPSTVGVQSMPKNEKDFSITLQNTHLLCADNTRKLRESRADLCCISTSGGAVSSRALYTNDDQHVIHLHGALLLNGIHNFIDQPDMAERSVILHPLPINPEQRKSEAELMADLEKDMPVILRGLYDYIAKIFAQPEVRSKRPERLIELSDWYARMEKVDGVDEGTYQSIYSANLRQAQLNSLFENALAVAIIQFAESLKNPWKGTPSDLLDELNQEVSRATQRSPYWPQNSIAFSKRILVLQTGLKSQGIYVTKGRRKERQILLTTDKLEEEY